MKTGITGPPYAGKTMLFSALTEQAYDALAHGRETHVGTVKVPDERVDRLYEMFTPKKKTYATMEFFDVAGRPGGEGAMDAAVLQVLKTADACIVVLDAFTPGVDPRKDFDAFMEELVFNDLIVITNRLERLERDLRAGKKDELLAEQAVLTRCREIIEEGGAIRQAAFEPEDEKRLRGFQFLSRKPLIIVPNIAESILAEGRTAEYETIFADVSDAACAAVCAEVEKEIAMLPPEDRPEFLESMGIAEPALGRLIRLSYHQLGLISFFTAGGTDEVRAWTIRAGSPAPVAAGVIHSDLERGFIRAETVTFDDLMAAGSFKAAREQGLLRIEGRDYIVRDGDVLTIRFSV